MKKKLLSILLSVVIWLATSLKDDGKISKQEVSNLVKELKDAFYDKAK